MPPPFHLVQCPWSMSTVLVPCLPYCATKLCSWTLVNWQSKRILNRPPSLDPLQPPSPVPVPVLSPTPVLIPTESLISSHSHIASDSSDDYILIPQQRKMQTMLDPKPAMIHHPSLSHARILMDGEITPKVVHDFETHCNTFFINAKDSVTEDNQVTKILRCFENTLAADWASTDWERLVKLKFDDFMKEFCSRWLLSNWEQLVRTQMLGTLLDPKKQCFETWAAQLQSYNVSLQNTSSHMTDDKLHLHMEILINQDLHDRATAAGANVLMELHPWMADLKQLDIKHQSDIVRWQKLCEAAVHAVKRPNLGNRSSATHGQNQNNNACSKGSTSSARASSNTQTNKMYPPKLTTNKCQLLFDHKECLRCQVFYASHQANQCTMVLSSTDYKTHTLQDALRTKAKSFQPPLVAAITETFSMSFLPDNNLVAAMFPPGSSMTMDKSLLDSSDASVASMSTLTPLKGKHLIWTCVLNNAPDSISIKAMALIDSESHMALIHPNLVSHLKFQSHMLAHPKRVNVAMGSSASISQLIHYIIIEPSFGRLHVHVPLHSHCYCLGPLYAFNSWTPILNVK